MISPGPNVKQIFRSVWPGFFGSFSVSMDVIEIWNMNYTTDFHNMCNTVILKHIAFFVLSSKIMYTNCVFNSSSILNKNHQ